MNYPLGLSLPSDTPHAVSVSLPRLADVIGYETGNPETWKHLTQGYPRFVAHPFVKCVEEWFRQKYGWENEIVALLADARAAMWLGEFVGNAGKIVEENGVTAVVFPTSTETAARAKAFVQHTGCGLSSRRAEDFLFAVGIANERFAETTFDGDAYESLTTDIARLYGAPSKNVTLANFGMSAAYAAFRAINAIQQPKKRTRWLQLGWLYVDTIRILERFSAVPLVLHDVADTAGIEKVFREYGHELAGVITELPTNPLVATVDLPRLHALAKQHDVALIADTTLGTPVVLDALPHLDIAVESLTKFACGRGDAVGGAAIVNPASPFADELRATISNFTTPIYARDVGRLALSIQTYETRVKTISKNTTALIHELEQIPTITKIHHARGGPTAANFAALARSSELTAGVISLEFARPFADVYDRLELPKGPSFGTEFTLTMPYLYLAHYELVSTADGRAELAASGINPELLRISVGLEDPHEIAEKIRAAVA